MVEKTKNKESDDRLTGPRGLEFEDLVFGRMLMPVSRRWDSVDPTATFTGGCPLTALGTDL